jgi:hypothetical protein
MYQNICRSITFKKLEPINAVLKNLVATSQTKKRSLQYKVNRLILFSEKIVLIYRTRGRTKAHSMSKMQIIMFKVCGIYSYHLVATVKLLLCFITLIT